jgi:hypothetical protein
MNRLNYLFLCESPTHSRDVSGDDQSALVDKLGVSPSRSRLPFPHRYHLGIVQQAQGRSTETAASPHYNNQSTIYSVNYSVTVLVYQLDGWLVPQSYSSLLVD